MRKASHSAYRKSFFNRTILLGYVLLFITAVSLVSTDIRLPETNPLFAAVIFIITETLRKTRGTLFFSATSSIGNRQIKHQLSGGSVIQKPRSLRCME